MRNNSVPTQQFKRWSLTLLLGLVIGLLVFVAFAYYAEPVTRFFSTV